MKTTLLALSVLAMFAIPVLAQEATKEEPKADAAKADAAKSAPVATTPAIDPKVLQQAFSRLEQRLQLLEKDNAAPVTREVRMKNRANLVNECFKVGLDFNGVTFEATKDGTVMTILCK